MEKAGADFVKTSTLAPGVDSTLGPLAFAAPSAIVAAKMERVTV
ncbi:MAG: hypothetical protein R2698_00055 [Microthrixaceae bacterium]